MRFYHCVFYDANCEVHPAFAGENYSLTDYMLANWPDENYDCTTIHKSPEALHTYLYANYDTNKVNCYIFHVKPKVNCDAFYLIVWDEQQYKQYLMNEVGYFRNRLNRAIDLLKDELDECNSK